MGSSPALNPEQADSAAHPTGLLPRWGIALASAALNRPFATIFCCLVLVVAVAVGLGKLRVESSYEIYFDDANPRLEALNALYARFSRNDNVLFAVAGDDGDGFSPEVLSAVHTLTERAWKLPFAVRVDSVSNFRRITSSADDVTIARLIDADSTIDKNLAGRVRDQAMGERGLVGRLVANDGGALGVNVRLELPNRDRESVIAVANGARSLASELRDSYPGVDIWISGNAMLNASFPEASLKDLKTLTPVMYAVMLLLLWRLFGSLSAAVASLLVVALCALTAMGAAGWMGLPLTTASVVAPTIISTVALADCVHVLTRYGHELVAGKAQREALYSAMVFNVVPIGVTSVTTAIGFLALNLSESPPFRDLGNIVAVGVMAGLLFSLTMLPALLTVWSKRASKFANRREIRVGRLGDYVVRHKWRIGAVTALLSVLLALPIARMELNDNYVEWFDHSIEFRSHTEAVEDRLTGIYQTEFVFDSGREDGLFSPDFLALLDRFQEWLESQPEVRHVDSIADVLKRLNQHLGQGSYALPASRDLAAQLILVYEMSVPQGLDLNSQIDVGRSATRVTVSLTHVDNQTLKAFESRAADWFKSNATPDLRPDMVGAAILFAYIAEQNIAAMIKGSVVAILIIALVLCLLYRSLWLGVLSLVPNLVPPVVAFGIWSLLVGRVGFALGAAFALVIGIVVDDTVHFVNGYLRARRSLGLNIDDALRFSFTHVGPALVNTSIILIGGFVVLTFSAFEPNNGLGLITALIIACALAVDFALLPAILSVYSRLSEREHKENGLQTKAY